MRASSIGLAAAWLCAAAPASAAPQGAASCAIAAIDKTGFAGAVAITSGAESFTYVQGPVAAPGSADIAVDTRFNIGSAGKMLTAVAIGQLLDAGKLSLSDPVGRYVDGLAPETASVTLYQLLTHTSGLGNFFTPDALAALREVKAMRDLLPLIAKDKPAFPAGSRFAYSNTGYAMLGLVVERASGVSYGQYLQDHIFAPAEMTNTGLSFLPGVTAVGATSGSMQPHLLPPRGTNAGPGGPGQGDDPGLSTLPPPAGPDPRAVPNAAGAPGPGTGPLHPADEAMLPATPAGGLYSTVGDLTRFFRALSAGKLLKPETYRDFTRRHVDAAPARGDLPALFQGLGFGTGDVGGHAWFGHNGGAPGLNADTAMFPDDDLIIVVLANRDPPVASTMMRSLRARMLDAKAVCS